MKAILNVFFLNFLLLTACGKWNKSENRLTNKPVLSTLVQAETKSRIDFSRHVKPILEARCVTCHHRKTKTISYLLTNQKEAFENERIIPGNPTQSPLYTAASGEHPPLGNSSKKIQIAATDLKVIERWILSGAIWPAGEVGQLEKR